MGGGRREGERVGVNDRDRCEAGESRADGGLYG